MNIFSNVIYSCDYKAEFSASLIQSHDPSEIIIKFWFAAQKTFVIIIIIIIIIIMLNTAEQNFAGFFFLERSEEQHLSEWYKSFAIYNDIIHVFIILFDQFKASLLNKMITFYNICSIIIGSPSILSESLLIKTFFFCILKYICYINIF